MFRNIKKNVRMRLTFETLKRYAKQKTIRAEKRLAHCKRRGYEK